MSKILQRNYETIQQHIQQSQSRSVYHQEVQLIAVTKTVNTAVMRQLLSEGIFQFGENRTQVLLEKQAALSDVNQHIEWHFIGRLQTRQVKALVGKVHCIHSLDRLSLASEIHKRFSTPISCFVQVNVSGEATKTGLSPEDVATFLQELAQYDRVQVVGLMTMAPFDASEQDLRTYFHSLKELQRHLTAQGYLSEQGQCLSMGMSQDYSIAIEEGATHVRVGTALYEGLQE